MKKFCLEGGRRVRGKRKHIFLSDTHSYLKTCDLPVAALRNLQLMCENMYEGQRSKDGEEVNRLGTQKQDFFCSLAATTSVSTPRRW